MSKPIPYMKFYIADYMGDTMHLSTLEHGAYMLIMCSYWQTKKPPLEDKIHKIARMTKSDWDEIRDTLADLFLVKDGAWTHKRIEAELKDVKVKAKQNREAGIKGANARWNKGRNGKAMADANDSLWRNYGQTESKGVEGASLSNFEHRAPKKLILDADTLQIMADNEDRWQMEARANARKLMRDAS